MVLEDQFPGGVYGCLFHHATLSSRSGMGPLVDALGARTIYYELVGERLARKSWRLSQLVTAAGIRYYGTTWNALMPFTGERNLVREIPRTAGALLHFIFADFTLPRRASFYRKRAITTVSTFHASATKLPQVLGRVRSFEACGWITLMSDSQRPFFLDRGIPSDRIRVILHGVDTQFFRPPEARRAAASGPLRALLVGKTERDHAFAARLIRQAPPNAVQLDVATHPHQFGYYQGTTGVRLLDRLDDDALVRAYQQADVLLMPMLDCSANNAVLESMACGTPVVANAVGGIPEYVGTRGGYVMPEKSEEAWIDLLRRLHSSRDELEARRRGVRAWAESFDWHRVAGQYLELYRHAAENPLW